MQEVKATQKEVELRNGAHKTAGKPCKKHCLL